MCKTDAGSNASYFLLLPCTCSFRSVNVVVLVREEEDAGTKEWSLVEYVD